MSDDQHIVELKARCWDALFTSMGARQDSYGLLIRAEMLKMQIGTSPNYDFIHYDILSQLIDRLKGDRFGEPFEFPELKRQGPVNE